MGRNAIFVTARSIFVSFVMALLAGEVAAGPRSNSAPPLPLMTEAERSGFVRTGRYDEVERLCAAFQAAEPTRVSCTNFGRTPEGRPLLALVVSGDGALDPERTRAKARPVILVQGGIHAGEIEGKDAIFLILRELLAGTLVPGVLGKVTLVLVPVYNVDGHERFGPANRPNQRGPAEMGFRTTALNLNLNRDYLKAEAPETQAMLALIEAWDPIAVVDLHTTDGAKFEHDVAVLVHPDAPRPDGLDRVAAALSDALQSRLTALGHLPTPFYPSFVVEDDPTSGFAVDSTPPRFSNAYPPTRNRIGILVETHSWKTYRQRVAATHDVLAALLERAAAEADAWRAAANRGDEAMAHLGGTDVVLEAKADEQARMIDFRGYAYEVTTSAITGARMIRYDERRPQIWKIPLREHRAPTLTVRAPGGGYVVPAGWAGLVAAKLQAHGLRFRVLPAAVDGLAVEAFRAAEVVDEARFEGRARVKLKGTWRAERRNVPAGSLFVPIEQPRALLVLHLLEPEAPDSLASWGFFNAVFERKEIMERYVLEEEARRMLQRDPALAAEFERRLHEDTGFAGSSERRRQFFLERHPSWDERLNLVPVMRVEKGL
jgi:hypothetical protein